VVFDQMFRYDDMIDNRGF